jgi:hypothetical protein
VKIKNFEYKKKKSGEIKKYLLMLLDENESHIGGIDFTKLEQDEIDEVIKIQSEYEKELKPFIEKAYRKYIKENIIDEHDTANKE